MKRFLFLLLLALSINVSASDEYEDYKNFSIKPFSIFLRSSKNFTLCYTKNIKTGKILMKFKADDPEFVNLTFIYSKSKPNTEYEISLPVKTKGIKIHENKEWIDPKKRPKGIFMEANIYDSTFSNVLSGDNEWTNLKMKVQTVENGDLFITLYLGSIESYISGIAYLDVSKMKINEIKKE